MAELSAWLDVSWIFLRDEAEIDSLPIPMAEREEFPCDRSDGWRDVVVV